MESLAFKTQSERNIGKQRRSRSCGNYLNFGWNIYPLIHAIYYVDTVEIVEIEKQYKQECV